MLDERTKVEVTVNFYPKEGPSWSAYGIKNCDCDVDDVDMVDMGIDALNAVISQLEDTKARIKRNERL